MLGPHYNEYFFPYFQTYKFAKQYFIIFYYSISQADTVFISDII